MNNTTISTAVQLLRQAAEELQQSHTTSRDRNDWTGEEDAKAAYDEHMAMAAALEVQRDHITELEAEMDAERRHHGIRNASAVRTLHALGYSWRGTDAWQPPAEQAAVPVAGQSRFKGEKDWSWCSPEHVAMVLATPSEWLGYEARYLYAHATPAHPAEGVPAQALDPVASMLTFVNGKPAKCGCRFSYSAGGGEYSDVGSVTLCAKHAGTERNGTERAEPFMWAIQEPDGSAYMDENCVNSVRENVQAEVDGLNSGLDAEDGLFKVVPVYLAATQPAAQRMDAEGLRTVVLDCPHSIEHDFLTLWIDLKKPGHNALNQLSLRLEAALAAQAKQGGASNDAS